MRDLLLHPPEDGSYPRPISGFVFVRVVLRTGTRHTTTIVSFWMPQRWYQSHQRLTMTHAYSASVGMGKCDQRETLVLWWCSIGSATPCENHGERLHC
jgi:hypothetical protein